MICGALITFLVELCPEANFPKETFFQCINKEKQTIPCSEAVHGSIMSFGCPAFYKTPYGTNNEKTTCVKGKWKPWQPQCVRIERHCGKLLASENLNEKGFKHPWTAGLYKIDNSTEEKYRYMCGASIISDFVVLTAAQCVIDESGVIMSRNYLVAAGKAYAKYLDSRDEQAQYKEVSHIITNPHYEPTFYNPGDLAVIFVQSRFELNSYVQPVCLPSSIDKSLQSMDEGVISQWKLDEGSDEFEEPEALEVKVTFSSKPVCNAKEYSRFVYKTLTSNNFCVQYSNDSRCMQQGEVGKGFYRQNPEDGRYYVYGVSILDLETPKEECVKHILLAETAFYYYFLECALSRYPENTVDTLFRSIITVAGVSLKDLL